jgi:AraC family ethanolamine operon transcriptional activator
VRFRLLVKSTADLAAIFNRQLRNAAVLSLEPGVIDGYVDVLVLPNIRLFRVTLNASVVLYADRCPGKKVFSIDLSSGISSDCIRAQGVTLTRPALFGFNANLKDLDLVLPAGSQMCAIALQDDFLLGQMKSLACEEVLETLDQFNVLSNSFVSSGLKIAIAECWSSHRLVSEDILECEIVASLIQCLLDKNERKVARIASRQDRHDAALKILSMTFSNPTKPFEIQDLANLLHQSRTSIFSGCKEKFGMTPVQVVRSVRLHQVRHALIDVEFSVQNNLNGVVDTAEYFGFVGRSHFARYYKNEFMETPRQTLASRRKSELIF